MRKFLSTLLAVCITVSVIFMVPLFFPINAESDLITSVNFEDAQATFYTTNAIASTEEVTLASVGGTHGTVMSFKKIQAYTSSRPSWDSQGWNTGRYPTMFRISNNAGNDTMHFEKDDTISVSFMIKNETDMNTEHGGQFYAAMIFADDYSNYNSVDLRDYIDKNKTARLAAINKSAFDWTEYSATITVPNSGEAAFVLYCDTWKLAGISVYVDDIVIKKASPESGGAETAEINFEGSQKDYQKAHALAYNDTIDLVNVGGNNVMQIKRLKGCKADVDVWNRGYPAAFLANNDSGTDCLKYNEDTILSISFKMKKNNAVSNDFAEDFKVALTFLPAIPNLITDQVYNYVNSGKTVTVETISNAADTDWETYSSTVTVPVTGYAVFFFYRTEWSTNTDIYIDDISIVPVEEKDITLKLNNTTYGDPSSQQEITINNKKSFSDIPVPYSDAAKFDGWYGDSEFKKQLNGIISNVTHIWAKWRTEKDNTVNTYDESAIVFNEWVTDNEYKMTSKTVGENTDTMFGQYDVQRLSNSLYGTSGNSMCFKFARNYDYPWPSLVKIYDSESADYSSFVPNPNSAYKISFDYRVDSVPGKTLNLQLRRLGTNDASGYNKDMIYLDQLVKINNVTGGWKTAESVFYTGSDVSTLAIQLVSSDMVPFPVDDVNVRIDNIEIVEIFNTPSIVFDTGDAPRLSSKLAVVGSPIPSIPVPVYEGYIFDGWFTDIELKNPFDLDVMPNRDITLYAKWTEPIDNAQDFKEDFEECYYKNNGVNANVSDNIASSELTWKDDSLNAYSGSGYITLQSNGTSIKSESDFPAVSFLNSDMSSYQVVKGGRYRIQFAMRSEKSNTYIYFVSSQQVPTMSINFNNSDELARLQYSAQLCDVDEGNWGIYETYFIPEKTGKLYILLSNAAGQVDIDDLSVTVVNENQASIVTYYNGNEKLAEMFGKVGTKLSDPAISNIRTADGTGDKDFNGWRYQNGDLYTDCTFPSEDTVLYASWKDRNVIKNTDIDWSQKITVDFEDAAGAKVFYGVYNNGNYMNEGMYFVSDDPAGAHSGKGYYRMENVGMWTAQWYRRFKFYSPDTDGNQIYLEPFGVYKVGFWLKLEKAGSSDVMLATYDNLDHITSYSKSSGINLQDSEQMNNIGKWVYYEDTITTGESVETLGMILAGGWLTASVDDITVTKLKELTVTFESNGGTKIDPISALSDTCIVPPTFPTREGYTFAGWYSDKTLKNQFKFNYMPITENITLYAKWTKDFVSEVYYEDVTRYEESEETVDVVPDDSWLDEQITVNKSDEIKKREEINNAQTHKTDSSLHIWIIVTIVAAVCAALVVAFIIIVTKRRKKCKAGGREL